MKIVVCIKQVPGTHEVRIDPETKRLVREGVEAIMNPFDTYALEQGVLLREAHGGEVIALSMGPKKAEETLREAIACGADQAILLNSRAFAGSDTWATSYALSMAIKKIGDVDLVICGKQAIDGDTAQVGPGIAAHLDLPQATNASAMGEVTDTTANVTRMHEDGYDICEVDLPAVVTVVKDINSPRIPSLKGRMAARKAVITVWNEEDISADPKLLGLDGSPTRVVETNPPPARHSNTMVIEGEPQECAKKLVHELRIRTLV
ncbi:MAG: electron transfer flavoprotein subunit beta/FixA family protein [Planctomycetes bacterium]|nr:electron transfer flavoprotein subunit beta/FixA family protein [Planctomycetota bacterium]